MFLTGQSLEIDPPPKKLTVLPPSRQNCTKETFYMRKINEVVWRSGTYSASTSGRREIATGTRSAYANANKFGGAGICQHNRILL